MATALERDIVRTYGRYFRQTGNAADAWNRTLDELSRWANGDEARMARRREVADILTRVRDFRRFRSVKKIQYNVHPLDVWGNRRDGYQVNDVYPSVGTIEVSENASHREVIEVLKRDGFIKRNLRVSNVSVEGEVGYDLYIGYAPTNHPEYELRRVD